MSNPGKESTEQEARHIRAAVLRITGQWYCSSSHHYTSAEPTTWRGRRICVDCKARINALRKASRKEPTRA
jgi:hypothetical protein